MSYKRKQQEIVCDGCNTKFNKDVSEIKRNIKLERKNYCSIRCSKKINSNLEHLARVRSTDITKLDSGNKRDEYTPFREHLRRAKRRKSFCNLTLKDMKEVWDNQQGLCIYSGVELKESSHLVKKYNNPIYTLSLDRIDSNIGYIKENIQFISIAMNHLKNNMTHEQMLEIIEILKQN